MASIGIRVHAIVDTAGKRLLINTGEVSNEGASTGCADTPAVVTDGADTGHVSELLRIALRGVGVVLPAVGVWGFVELRGGVPSGDFGTFLGAMALSLLTAGVWSAIDARRAPTVRVSTRWVAVAVVVGAGVGLDFTVTAPNSSPGPERAAEVFWSSLFYIVPLLVAAGVGVAIGAERRRGCDGTRG